MNFSIEKRESSDATEFLISGPVNENSQFPTMPTGRNIRINLAGASALNSVGTRNWCKWVAQVQPPNVIYMEKCSATFVRSFNIVRGTWTQNMKLVSFYVPFAEPTSGKRHDVLVTASQVTPDGQVQIPEQKDEKGVVLELDVLDTYFRFLKL